MENKYIFNIKNKKDNSFLFKIYLEYNENTDEIKVYSDTFIINIINYYKYIQNDISLYNINEKLVLNYFDKFNNIIDWYNKFVNSNKKLFKNNKDFYKQIFDYIKSDMYLFCCSADGTISNIETHNDIIIIFNHLHI